MKKIFLTLTLLLTLLTATVFAAEEPASDSVEYTSATYGYKILCPVNPAVVVMPKGYLDKPEQHGERLIFANQGMDILLGYDIILDAFDTNVVPDYNKGKKKIIDNYLEELKKNNPYEIVELIEVTKGNKGVFVVPAREMEYKNENGETITADVDAPSAITFFRTKSGRCVSIALISEDMSTETLDVYRKSMATFLDATDLAMTDKNDKKNKKSKK